MKIAVLGAGAGGTATAFDCASHGHEVRLFDFAKFPQNIAGIAKEKSIHAQGDISGSAHIECATHDIDEALRDAELIYVVGPAYSTTPFGKAVAGKLKAGQTVIVTPSSCGGALAFKKAAGLAVDDDSIRVAETSTLHYAVRLTAPGRIHVFLKLKAGNLLAALPGTHTDDVLRLIEDVYPSMERAEERDADQPAKRQPDHPSGRHAGQRGTHRHQGRRLPVLRGGRERRDRPADRGDGQGAHRTGREHGGHRAARPGDGHAPGLHAGGQLWRGVSQGAGVQGHWRAAAARSSLPQ